MTVQETARQGRIYQQAAQFQRELALSQSAAQDQILASWARAYERIRVEYQGILDQVAEAHAEGRPIKPAWLYQQERLANAEATARAELARYAKEARQATLSAEQAAIGASARHHAALGQEALSQANLAATFVQVNPDNLRHLAGTLADGSPLSTLFSGMAEEVASQARDALLQGIALGKGPAWMAQQIGPALDMPRHRAVTIMRTETQRVYRETARETYMANADVLQGWVWTATLTRRTCAACIAMHGTIHPVTEHLDGHPRCRCAMVPRTKSWADLGMDPSLDDMRAPLPESGKDWLAAQPVATQRAIMGNAKHRAWQEGEITLDDMVARHHSADWGTMRRERSLVEIREGRNANTLPGSTTKATHAAPAPEPAYVDKFVHLLEAGEITPAQLTEAVAQASPLGKANAAEAIRVHLERAAKAQEAAAAARNGGPRLFGSAQEARDWANGHWAGPEGYTADELAVMRDYTGSAFGPMNNTLRSGKGKRLNAKIRTMDQAMEHAARVPDDIQVVRNANLRQLGITGSRQDPKTAVGRILEEHGYLSTSINRTGGMQGEVRLLINVPKGSRGVYVSGKGGPKGPNIISDFGGGESELILDRGGRLVIKSVRKVGKRWHVEADWHGRE